MDSTDKAVLPAEIWSQIFTYLPLDDRKNVRTTCRRFYELCNDTYIQSKEEILFYGNINTVSALLLLSNISRKVWNIKLKSVNVTDDSILPFFEKQGTNVRSLIFHTCTFAPGVLKSIIEHCVGLCSIAFIFISAYPDKNEGSQNEFFEYILNDFKALENNLIIRNTVTDFTLTMPFKNNLSNLKFLRFFSVFPNIKRLDLEIDIGQEFDQFSTISSDVTSDSGFSVSCIYHQLLAMSSQLEKLRLKFENNPTYYSCVSVETLIKISNIEIKNLKELSLNWIILESDISIAHPFLECRNLTHFDFNIYSLYLSHASVSTFLQLLLNSITTLRSLTIRARSFRIDSELFQALVKSKLITLNIHMRDSYILIPLTCNFKLSVLENKLSPNYNLKHLHIEREQPDLMFIFSTYFRSVKSLEFPEVHEDVLQNIFEYQTSIRKLALHNCRRWPYKECVFRKLRTFQRWLRKEEMTIRRELEYLIHLHITEDKYCLTNFILSEFLLPKLKSLSVFIHFNMEFDDAQLWQLIQKLPGLQNLQLHLPVATSFQQWLALLNDLTKLRHFYMTDLRTELFHDSEYRQLFSMYPSLRTVEHRLKNNFPTCAKYFYDITTKTIKDISKSSDFNLYEVRSPIFN